MMAIGLPIRPRYDGSSFSPVLIDEAFRGYRRNKHGSYERQLRKKGKHLQTLLEPSSRLVFSSPRPPHAESCAWLRQPFRREVWDSRFPI